MTGEFKTSLLASLKLLSRLVSKKLRMESEVEDFKHFQQEMTPVAIEEPQQQIVPVTPKLKRKKNTTPKDFPE